MLPLKPHTIDHRGAMVTPPNHSASSSADSDLTLDLGMTPFTLGLWSSLPRARRFLSDGARIWGSHLNVQVFVRSQIKGGSKKNNTQAKGLWWSKQHASIFHKIISLPTTSWKIGSVWGPCGCWMERLTHTRTSPHVASSMPPNDSSLSNYVPAQTKDHCKDFSLKFIAPSLNQARS